MQSHKAAYTPFLQFFLMDYMFSCIRKASLCIVCHGDRCFCGCVNISGHYSEQMQAGKNGKV